MAKHFYHIPLQEALHFIKTHKSALNRFTTEKQELAYCKQLGKSHYTLQIEQFIDFFKINNEIAYALKTMAYFHSTEFITKMAQSLNFSQFSLQEKGVENKEFFYALCYLYATNTPETFAHFIQQSCIYYHSAFQPDSPIAIDHQAIVKTLAKSRNLTLKESFGEEKEEAFFKLFVDGKLSIEARGKRIKTLRKKAYKRLFYQLLDWD